jgi:hypothetical protein
VGTTNIGSRAPACPPFIVVLRERGPTAIHDRRPRSGRGSDWFPDPEITFLTCSTTGGIISFYHAWYLVVDILLTFRCAKIVVVCTAISIRNIIHQ